MNPPNEWKKLDLVRKLCWDKMSDYRKQSRPITGRHSDDIMSVADYGPSSQTLTFLDPEDDLGSLGIGADTQVDIFEFDVTCKFPSLSIKKLTIQGDGYDFHYTLPSQSQHLEETLRSR